MKKINSRAKSKSSPSSAATKHKETELKKQDTTAPITAEVTASKDNSSAAPAASAEQKVSAERSTDDKASVPQAETDAKSECKAESASETEAKTDADTKSAGEAETPAENKAEDKADTKAAETENTTDAASKEADEGKDADSAQAEPKAEAESKTEAEDKNAADADQAEADKAEADPAETTAAADKAQANDKNQDLTTKDSAETKAPDNAPPGAAPLAPKIRKMTATKKKEAKSLATTEDTPIAEAFKSRIIVVTSGKGGVGKTTSAAAISMGLALRGHKTAVIDFDVGLRNLDLIMGVELRVVYDFINVIHGEVNLNQALIKDRHTDNLYILPASQTRDKDALTYHGVGLVMKELSDMGFEYIVCDSPAGIEAGALIALYYSDEAIVTTNPEVSSVRDSDRIIGILNARSRRAEQNLDPVIPKLLLTRYIPERVDKGEMLSNDDIQELLSIPLLGIIPESPDVLKASNTGETIILNQESEAGQAYNDAVERLLGKEVPFRFYQAKKKGFLAKLFGGGD